MLLFLRSMGGAFGSTLVGAILVSRFATVLATNGLTTSIDFGNLHSHANGLDSLPAASRAAVQAGLAGAFHWAFWACALMMGVACVVVSRMRDLPLRTSSAQEPAPLAH
jgi:hypothetical protein